MNERTCWQMIESSWAKFPQLNNTRLRAIALNNATALEQLGLLLDGLIAAELRKQLQGLEQKELLGFIDFLENQLQSVRKMAIPHSVNSSDSDIRLALAFAIGMGESYFQKIRRAPIQLHSRLQSKMILTLGPTVYGQNFGALPDNYASFPSISNRRFRSAGRKA